MKGRDLIVYILTHGLEDEPVIKNGIFIGLLSVEETAVKMGVGTATIDVMIQLGMLDSIDIKGGTYILSPRGRSEE